LKLSDWFFNVFLLIYRKGQQTLRCSVCQNGYKWSACIPLNGYLRRWKIHVFTLFIKKKYAKRKIRSLCNWFYQYLPLCCLAVQSGRRKIQGLVQVDPRRL